MDKNPEDVELPKGLRSPWRTIFLYVLCSAMLVTIIFLPIFLSTPPRTQTPKPRLNVKTEIPEDAPEVMRECIARGVAIRVPHTMNAGRTDWAYGTGFIIHDGIVMTAAHVIAKNATTLPKMVDVYCDRTRVDGTVLVYDRLRDISVLKTNGCHAVAVQFDTGPLLVNDLLVSAGYSFSTGDTLKADGAERYFALTSPIPTALINPDDLDAREFAEQIREMQMRDLPRFQALAGAAEPGESGSPVFRRNGTVVGMVVIRDEGHNRTFIVPSVSLKHVLHDAGIE